MQINTHDTPKESQPGRSLSASAATWSPAAFCPAARYHLERRVIVHGNRTVVFT